MVDNKQFSVEEHMFPYFDSAMCLKMIQFYLEKGAFDSMELKEMKMKILGTTFREEEIAKIAKEGNFKELMPAIEGSLKEYEKKLKFLEKELADIIKACEKKDCSSDSWRPGTLGKIGEKAEAQILEYSKVLYEKGDFKNALKYLSVHRKTATFASDSTLWGLLAAGIALEDYESAQYAFKKLRIKAESGSNAVEQQGNLAWLLHWNLFLAFSSKDRCLAFAEMACNPAYELIMEISCPHLARYFICSLLLSKHPELLRVLGAFIQEIKHKFSDPFTELILILTESFDFTKIPALLERTSKTISADFFLHKYHPELLENLQELIINVHANLYSKICVSDLVKLANLKEEKVISICEAKATAEGNQIKLSADKRFIELMLVESDPNKRLDEYTQRLQARAKLLEEQIQFFAQLHLTITRFRI